MTSPKRDPGPSLPSEPLPTASSLSALELTLLGPHLRALRELLVPRDLQGLQEQQAQREWRALRVRLGLPAWESPEQQARRVRQERRGPQERSDPQA